MLTRNLLRQVTRSRCYATKVTAPAELSEGERTIFNKLSTKFEPSKLQVADVSGGCGTFYAVEIASPAFKGLNALKRHRLVNDVLKDDIKDMHGLQLKVEAE